MRHRLDTAVPPKKPRFIKLYNYAKPDAGDGTAYRAESGGGFAATGVRARGVSVRGVRACGVRARGVRRGVTPRNPIPFALGVLVPGGGACVREIITAPGNLGDDGPPLKSLDIVPRSLLSL